MIAKETKTHLVHNILHLLLHLLLRPLKPLPQLIAHAAALQQRLQRLFSPPQLHDPRDILERASQQRGFQQRIRHLLQPLLLAVSSTFTRVCGVEVQEAEVDVAGFVGGEPGFEVRGFAELAFVAQRREGVEAADHDGEVEDGQGEVRPEGFRGLGGLPGFEGAVRRGGGGGGVEGAVVAGVVHG